jgi:ariadne-1
MREPDDPASSNEEEDDASMGSDDGSGSGYSGAASGSGSEDASGTDSAGLGAGDDDDDDEGGTRDGSRSGGASGSGGAGGAGGGKGSKGYRVITADSLAALQRAAIGDVVAVWGVAPSVAKTLLMAYFWDKERLLSDLGDRGEDAVYKAAGLATAPSSAADAAAAAGAASAAAAAPSSSRGKDAAAVTCGVCMCETPAGECSTNSCGHAFCNDCWRGHLGVQIAEGNARRVACMAFKCGVVCDDDLVARVMAVRGGEGRRRTKGGGRCILLFFS